MIVSDVSTKADAFASELDSLIKTITNALSEYEREPREGMEFAYKKWRDTAVRLLSADLLTTRNACLRPDDPINLRRLLDVGSNEIGLAKNLDTFRFDFAGKSFDEELNTKVSATVHTASELIRAIAGKS